MEIVVAGHETLRTAARPVPMPNHDQAGLTSLVDSMVEAMRAAPGVGLAANQVGREERVIVLEDRSEYQAQVPEETLAARERAPFDLEVLINPTLEAAGDEVREWFEGCLSIPGYTAIVPRWRSVRVTATAPAGNPVEYVAVGWHARVLQHEVDHLNGMLYVDRMLPRSFMTSEAYLDFWGTLPMDECRSRLGLPEPG